ncbi:MAG: Mu transposase C-terminal domain-containing protein [Fluviicola sp.]|nr:Mu transposase C-terminal domain-containing protein [Fluviicola sp.]
MKNIVPGSSCSFEGKRATIQKFIDFKKVIVQEDATGELHVREISELDFDDKPIVNEQYIDSISDEDWIEANRRYSIIKPLIEVERGMKLEINKTVLVRNLSEEHHVGYVTIYRWLSAYNNTGLLSSLVPTKRDGGKDKSRLSEEVVLLMDSTIQTHYLNAQKRSKKNTAIEVIRCCKNAGLEAPHTNTIYNRIKLIDKKKVLTSRLGHLEVSQTIAPTPGEYTDAKNPLDVVQIDHTLLDIFVVSEEDRMPICRPFITLAIDVYSRMVAGLYISLDPPGVLGTGICLSNAILPKEDICAKYQLKSSWPLWGIMRNLHMDNAKEFRGKMLKRAGEEYGFTINWRPKAKSRYGAHVERLLGTLARKIHSLPGTTFELIKYRHNYDSEAKATMTLGELEKWLHIQIADVYHNEKHSGIKMSPLNKYNEGIFGSDRKEGIGIPLMQFHPDKVKLDFLPMIERTIQRTGVVIDHIRYFSDIFKTYLYERAAVGSEQFAKNRGGTNFIFKRDPRDISKIYFLDEKEARYAEVPYADMRRPPMSIWEHRAALKRVQEFYPHSKITEDIIFDAHNRLREIEENSKASKKEAKRVERKRKVAEFNDSLKKTQPEVSTDSELLQLEPVKKKMIEPFDFDEEL